MVSTVRITVRGTVQGVGFRDATRAEAERLGVAGWVRNAGDGTVEVHAEGEPDAVDALSAWCEHGPRAAQVDGADVREAEAESPPGFSVR